MANSCISFEDQGGDYFGCHPNNMVIMQRCGDSLQSLNNPPKMVRQNTMLRLHGINFSHLDACAQLIRVTD